MADPTYTFEIELATGSFTNLSSKVERASWGQALFDVFAPPRPQQALFELANDDGTMSPRVNSSFLPGKALRLTATYAGSSYPLFFGRITDISLSPRVGGRTTLIEAVDDLDRVSRVRYNTPLYASTNVSSVFCALMSMSNVRSFSCDDVFDVSDFSWWKDTPALEALDDLTRSGGYSLVVDGAGTFYLRGRYWKNFDMAVASYDAAADIRYSLSQESIINKMRIAAISRQIQSAVSTLAVLDEVLTVPGSSSIGFWLSYQDPREPSAVTPVASVVTPVASTDYRLTDSFISGSDVTSSVGLSFTSFAASAVATLTNNTGTAAYLHGFQVRGFAALRKAEITAESNIGSSQTIFGVRELRIDDSILQNYSFLDSFTKAVTSERSLPRDREKLALTNEFPGVLAHTIGDVLSVDDTFVGTPINSWKIRSASHELSLTDGLNHSVDYQMETFTQQPYLVLDDSSRGKLDDGRILAI